MIRCRALRRRAYLIPLVAVVLGALLIFLGATSLLTSTTALSSARVNDLRVLLETCRAAEASAVQAVRSAINHPGTPGADPFDWRTALTPPYARARPSRRVAVPHAIGERFDSDLDVRVSDVDIGVVDWFEPADYHNPEFAPQGVLELAVSATIERGTYRVRRTVIERRVFYVTAQAPAAGTALKPGDVDVIVASTPLATVIAP